MGLGRHAGMAAPCSASLQQFHVQPCKRGEVSSGTAWLGFLQVLSH